MSAAHDLFLNRLQDIATVRLVARLEDAAATGNSREDSLNVFVPDLHLLSRTARARYSYGFDSSEMFSKLIDVLLQVENDLFEQDVRLRVMQMGDFVDLWRQSVNAVSGVSEILEDFPDIRDRFLRNADGSVAARLLLGNHDLEARESRNFVRARMSHYPTRVGRTVMATHGDVFDLFEQQMPTVIKALALTIFGRIPQPVTYPMNDLRDLRDRETTPATELDKIQGNAVMPAIGDTVALPAGVFNVITVSDPAERRAAHSLLPNAVTAAETIRQQVEQDGTPTAPNLRVIVIGHSHYARLIHDTTADLILMDCGAWLENYKAAQEPEKPNRQLGVICGADLRIYQLD